MSSIEERMKVLQTIEIDEKEEFVVKIKGKDVKVLVYIQKLEYNLTSSKSNIDLCAINPNPLDPDEGTNCYNVK